MRILPLPKKIQEKYGFFFINEHSKIVLDFECSQIDTAIFMQKELRQTIDIPLSKGDMHKNDIYLKIVKGENPQGYQISINEDNILIIGNSPVGLFYATQTLLQIIKEYGVKIPCLELYDYPDYKVRGYYYDVARGKVPTLEWLKALVRKLATYKINQLQLYVEHTFAFSDMSEVWRGSDPLSSEDILILDSYCKKYYIELVPSFSTFGHLYHLLSSKTYCKYCEIENISDKPYNWFDRQVHYTIDAINPESLILIQKMIQEVSPLFSSDKFNICCDETFDICKGKNKDVLKEKTLEEVYLNFLNKICDIVKNVGKTPMFWGDVIGNYENAISKLPENSYLLTWDYSIDPNEDNVKKVYECNQNQYVCPSVSGYNRLINDYNIAWSNIEKLAQIGKKYNAEGFLITDWGDMGNVNIFATSVPPLILGAVASWGNVSENIDEMISIVEYGENAKETVGLLKQLSNTQKFNWADLVSWRYEKEKITTEVIKPWVNAEFCEKVSFKELEEAYEKASEKKNEIQYVCARVESSQKESYSQLVLVANAIMLFNAFFAIIKKYDYNSSSKIIIPPLQLAEDLELWFYKYEKIWRCNNRESELFRIKDMIFYACDYLRGL